MYIYYNISIIIDLSLRKNCHAHLYTVFCTFDLLEVTLMQYRKSK